ncbi:MAG: HDOD domain-containing protein [Calditrichaeota bacterium]|nr:HDOD domain-containing protein [Calditrichota bacterium]
MIEKLKSKLMQFDQLVPLPSIMKNILDLTEDPNVSVREIAEEIKKDQALTAKILKIVNSAYYGFYREIGNVDHAIVVLGIDEIVNISQAICLMQYQIKDIGNFFNCRKFWIHTIGTAYIARALSRYTPGILSKDAFVIGLLHDFGKAVMNQHFHNAFSKVMLKAMASGGHICEVCQEEAGVDHAEVGALVAENWNLPVQLVVAIRLHHNPEKSNGNSNAVHIAHLANALCHKYKIGESGNAFPDEPSEVSLKALGIEDQDLDELWESLDIDPIHIEALI